MAHLLAMTKPSSGVCPIVVRKHYIVSQVVFYAFTSMTPFATHFSPQQFGIATKGGCEVVIHGIRCTITLHPNWVVFQLHVANTFNLVLKRVIFQKLCAVGGNLIQFIPFVHAFYAFESPLFYNHHNCEGNIIIIPSIMGTQ
jgi:hypothetical protein